MKLKCTNHGRRVVMVSTLPRFVHRTGDNSICNAKTAVLVDNTSKIVRTFAVIADQHNPKRFSIAHISTNKK